MSTLKWTYVSSFLEATGVSCTGVKSMPFRSREEKTVSASSLQIQRRKNCKGLCFLKRQKPRGDSEANKDPCLGWAGTWRRLVSRVMCRARSREGGRPPWIGGGSRLTHHKIGSFLVKRCLLMTQASIVLWITFGDVIYHSGAPTPVSQPWSRAWHGKAYKSNIIRIPLLCSSQRTKQWTRQLPRKPFHECTLLTYIT